MPAAGLDPRSPPPLGGGEAVIPDALLHYQRRTGRTDSTDGGNGDGNEVRGGMMLRALVEVDRATMGPERLTAKLTAYARLHRYTPTPVARQRQQPSPEPTQENWRQRYPLFPRLLFVLVGTGPAGITARLHAIRITTRDITLAGFLRKVPVLATSLTDLLQHGPATPVWRPIQEPDHRVDWMHTRNS